MIPSNILGVLNPPEESKSINEEEACLPCQVIGSFTCLMGGLYFMSEMPFKEDEISKKAKPNKPLPGWWKPAVKSSGAVLFALGVYRGGEGWLWNKDLKFKKPYF